MNPEKSKTHGGFREGAGRKKEFGETTKVMRVPESMVDEVRKFIESRTEASNDLQDKIYELEQEHDELAQWRQTYEPYLLEYKQVRNKLRVIGDKISQKQYDRRNLAPLKKDVIEILQIIGVGAEQMEE